MGDGGTYLQGATNSRHRSNEESVYPRPTWSFQEQGILGVGEILSSREKVLATKPWPWGGADWPRQNGVCPVKSEYQISLEFEPRIYR